MRHLLTLAARLGLNRSAAASAALVAAGLLVSTQGYALEFCDAKTPCGIGAQCFGWMCVPTASVCNPAAPACASWQTCDMTCKVMGSSSSGSGGTSTVDAGSSGGSGSGGSGAVPPATDGGSSSDPMPPAPDASTPGDAQSPMPEIDGGPMPPAPDCPKDIGLCLPDPAKIVIQSGCQEFCDAAMKCGGIGGGSSGSDPGEMPPQVDGGSTEPMPAQDAGSVDAGSAFAPDATEGKVPQPDGGSQAPDPLEIKACLQMCSVIKLNGAGKAEFDAAAACIAKNGADCKAIETNCAAALKAFEDVIDKDPSLQLALMGLGFGGGSSSGGNTTDPVKGDAESQTGSDAGSTSGGGDSFSSSDTGSAAPRNPDAAIGDASVKTDTTTTAPPAATSSSDDGCTAGPAASQPGALALLIAGLFGVLRRRRSAQV
jgi:MYXO-CTERM domain-containing protein